MARSILLIDDDPQLLAALTTFFERRGWAVARALDGRSGIELYERDAPDLVLTDLDMPGLSGLQVVDVLRSRDPEAIVLLLTGHGDVASAVEAMQLGAENFLAKPVDFRHLEIAVERAFEKAVLRRSVLAASRPSVGAGAVTFGASPARRRLSEQLARLAQGAAPILLAGESGTGKGWVAGHEHAASPRAGGPFVHVNCAGLSAATLAAELFGHERGAVAGAPGIRRGLVELADGGTLFLDQVGDLAPELQATMLAVLESRRFRRLGGTREIETDVRVVSATHVDLREAVRAGRFREDLYHRLAALPVGLPPLRARGADEIARLGHALLDELARQAGRSGLRLEPDALLALTRYAWPGNVRELRNVLERAVLLAGSDLIARAHLPPEFEAAAGGDAVDPFGGADVAAGESDMTLHAVERAHILRVLALCNYNKVRAARALGITRPTLYSKLREYGVETPSRGGPATAD
ncbi:MAG: sigma-54-dependent transcriptional regulator [Gemmatirosa sp.]